MSQRTPLIAIVLAAALIGAGWWFFAGRSAPPPTPVDEGPGTTGSADPDRGTETDPFEGTGGTTPDGPTIPEVPEGPLMEAIGQVIDQVTGRGVPGATITVTESLDARIPPLGHCRTESTGVFIHDFPERETFQLTVRAEGYAPARWEVIDGMTPSGIPLELANLELPIAPESVLWIRPQVDGLSEEDRLVVEVQLRQARTPAELGTPGFEKQNFPLLGEETRIGNLATGKYLLNFRTSRQRLGSREIELGMGEEQVVEFALGPPIPVDGVVRHNGRAVTGGRLMIWGRDNHSNTTAVIDDTGRYSVNLPSPGVYSFAFSPDRDSEYDGNGGSTDVLVTEGGIVDLEFRSSHLVGRVTGPYGEPLPQLSGTLFGPQALSFQTDDQGTFEFFDVPHGTYRWLFPHAPEGSFGASREFTVEGDATVEYRFEESTTIEVVIQHDPPPIDGQDVGRPQVVLLEAEGVMTPLRSTGRDHTFHWPVEGGLCAVVQPGWAPSFFEVPASDTPSPHTVVLTPGGELTVTIVAPGGRTAGSTPFTIVPLEAPDMPLQWRQRRTGGGGSTRLTLPPGTYRIEAEVGGETVAREIEVHPRAGTEARLP